MSGINGMLNVKSVSISSWELQIETRQLKNTMNTKRKKGGLVKEKVKQAYMRLLAIIIGDSKYVVYKRKKKPTMCEEARG